MFFLPEIVFNEFLFYLFIYYKHFFYFQYNNVSFFHKYITSFDSVTSKIVYSGKPLCNEVSNKINAGSDFVTPCYKFLKYIDHIKDTPTEPNVTESCQYLNYMLIDEIIRIKKSHIEQEKYKEFLETYKTHFPDMNTCINHMKYIDNRIFEDVKKIFELYNNFHKFLTVGKSSKDCKDLDKCIQLYMSYQNCRVDRSNKEFCKAIEKFRNYYYGYITNTATVCSDRDIYLPSFEMLQEGLIGSEEVEESSFHDGGNHTISPMLEDSYTITLIAFSIIFLISLISYILYKVNI